MILMQPNGLSSCLSVIKLFPGISGIYVLWKACPLIREYNKIGQNELILYFYAPCNNAFIVSLLQNPGSLKLVKVVWLIHVF